MKKGGPEGPPMWVYLIKTLLALRISGKKTAIFIDFPYGMIWR
jgi:hypothetical protein